MVFLLFDCCLENLNGFLQGQSQVSKYFVSLCSQNPKNFLPGLAARCSHETSGNAPSLAPAGREAVLVLENLNGFLQGQSQVSKYFVSLCSQNPKNFLPGLAARCSHETSGNAPSLAPAGREAVLVLENLNGFLQGQADVSE